VINSYLCSSIFIILKDKEIPHNSINNLNQYLKDAQ
jgi:hypothetical protein